MNLIKFEKKVNALTAVLFFMGMLIFHFFKWLPIWAAASASLFVAITLRQFLIGKVVDIFMSIILLGSLFVTNSFYYSERATGVVLMIAAVYVFVRQCVDIYLIRTKKVHEPVNPPALLDEDDPGN